MVYSNRDTVVYQPSIFRILQVCMSIGIYVCTSSRYVRFIIILHDLYIYFSDDYFPINCRYQKTSDIIINTYPKYKPYDTKSTKEIKHIRPVTVVG